MAEVPSEQVIALSLLTAAETAHAFSAFLPSYFTIRTFALEGSPEEVRHKLKNLRSGYLPSAFFGLALGSLVSVLAKSTLPLVTSAATIGFMILQYEHALPPDLRLTMRQALPHRCYTATFPITNNHVRNPGL